MDGVRDFDDGAAVADLLDWWAEAGVDVAVGEAPRNWLRPAAPLPATGETRVLETTAASGADAPADLAGFQAWLAAAAGLPLDRAGARRVLPHGADRAEVMLLSEMPSRDDGEQPIGGEAWALAVRMLAAIGIAPDAAYSASLACFQAPGARLGGADLARCAEIARRHVALAAPRRLLLLGEAPARALLGKPLAAARGHVHKVEGVRAVATFHPRWLLQRPADKALAWRDLLLLTEEDS